jgi:hypothetical protein
MRAWSDPAFVMKMKTAHFQKEMALLRIFR